MDFGNFKTYGDSSQQAFETLCNQLFERYLRRKYGTRLIKFRVINGAGGDGGIEAYGQLDDDSIIAIQAKWFRDTIKNVQIRQIDKSITTALALRPHISEYILCVPRNLSSLKFGRGSKGSGPKPTLNNEEKRVDTFTDKIQNAYPKTTITWWFESDIHEQLLQPDNDGIQLFWFDKELISINHLVQQFDLAKKAWLETRYIPQLHGRGIIQHEIDQLLFNQAYRKDLLNHFNHEIGSLTSASDLIEMFLSTLESGHSIESILRNLQNQITTNRSQLLLISQAISNGIDVLPAVMLAEMPVNDELFDRLFEIKQTDVQFGKKERLIRILYKIQELDLRSKVENISKECNQTGRLFLGNSGTGKTHALGNTVDSRLNRDKLPAIIVRGKGTPCGNWSEIFADSLDLSGWNRNQVLSALETLAIRADNIAALTVNPGDEVIAEPAKVIICIDGLEEAIEHWDEWYERIRESIQLIKLYPRVRFVFTARPYFLNENEIPTDVGFQITQIPSEGDVPVSSVIDIYFGPEFYDIEVNPRTLIRGLDSLYALRLFCEMYTGQKLTSESDLFTAEGDLLNLKISKIELDFKRIMKARGNRTPVRDAITAISEIFYNEAEVEHHTLFENLRNGTVGYLDSTAIDTLIEYLANNGFLTKSESLSGSGVLKKIQIIYTLPYQSIMELIISEKCAEAIINKEIDSIPIHLITPAMQGEIYPQNHLQNEKIVQQIVNHVFYKNNLLIGVNNFLSEGLEPEIIAHLQLQALTKAPAENAKLFRPRIDELFLNDYKTRYYIFKDLIFPSSSSASNFFGADYLHELLMRPKSAFEREKIWLGWDSHEIHKLGDEEKRIFRRHDLSSVFDGYGIIDLQLPALALHNELPLVYGWALTTLDQPFRAKLRHALTEWALFQPLEFLSLLQKLFDCNDPQIQEDLASITLGLASKLKDKKILLQIATWTIENVFSKKEFHRNIVVRTGFRAIVEKAYFAGVINEGAVNTARPQPGGELVFIPLDRSALSKKSDEVYPIGHDLAWYVIKDAYQDFLDYANVSKGDVSSESEKVFLLSYLDQLSIKTLSSHSWSISAAIAYMKSLGFSRRSGSTFTKASHGSKSDEFTLEEKYTWLAVHYLKGYLSDYLPLEETGEFVEDYMQIVSVDNPAEELLNVDFLEQPDIEDNWVIKETLAPEMPNAGSVDQQIEIVVNNEPIINFEKWIEFQMSDFKNLGSDVKLLSLMNFTSVHDSRNYIYSRLDIKGVIVDKGQTKALLKILNRPSSVPGIMTSIDRLMSAPNTDTYSNPSDIVWMSWIDEAYCSTKYYDGKDAKKIQFTIASVTKQTVDGEEEKYIPSKLVRTLMNITEMHQQTFVNDLEETVAFNHWIRYPNYDRQDMTLILKNDFLNILEKNNLEIVWFAELYRTKNPLNDDIKSDSHPMKTRKYLVWYDKKGNLQSAKYWDARFSNQR